MGKTTHMSSWFWIFINKRISNSLAFPNFLDFAHLLFFTFKFGQILWRLLKIVHFFFLDVLFIFQMISFFHKKMTNFINFQIFRGHKEIFKHFSKLQLIFTNHVAKITFSKSFLRWFNSFDSSQMIRKNISTISLWSLSQIKEIFWVEIYFKIPQKNNFCRKFEDC